MRNSQEIDEELRHLQKELEKKKHGLLERREVLIQRLEEIFPVFFDSAIERVISNNADRILDLPAGDIGKLREELNQEKPNTIQDLFNALRSSQDWLQCPLPHTSSSSDPIGLSGINYDGSIWKLIEGYSRRVSEIFSRYDLKVHSPIGLWDYQKDLLKPLHGFFEIHKLKEFNDALGKAHSEYCNMRSRIESFEQELKQARALEKFQSTPKLVKYSLCVG